VHRFNRRDFLALASAIPALPSALAAGQTATPRPGRMFVAMHEVSSSNFDYRTAMEGYSKAGIRAVEVVLNKVREFVSKESPATARRLLDDLGLKAISTSNHIGVIEPNPDRAKSLDDLRSKCELAATLGADKIVVVPVMTTPPAEDDYKRAVPNLREAGDIAAQHNVSLIVEFVKLSTFVNCLPSALQIIRGANHPHVRVMFDTYHLWNGISKLEDLELLRDGEVLHVHFEDTPAEPVRELLEQRHRVLPGEGVAPLKRIVDTLRRQHYAGALSVEMLDPAVQAMEPFQLATRVRAAVGRFLA
jgi:2-keto-myo-inositol isomerase